MDRSCASAVSTLSGLALLALGGALATLPAIARAETTACAVVSAMGSNISVPGHYCLEQDFDYTGFGTAISIQADNVVFDCNHHRVTNTGAPGQYTGILVTNNRKGVVVRNCTIDAFSTGIFLQSTEEPGSTGNRIEDNTVLRSGGVGILVYGSYNRIERNRITGNTGSTYGQASGIELWNMNSNGTSNAIRDNVISDFKPPPPTDSSFPTHGIRLSGAHNSEVTGNTITGLYAPTGRTVVAIASYGSRGQLFARNVVLSPPPLPAPLDGTQGYGILVSDGPTENVCRDNVVGHFASANLSGCIDSVNTDF